MILAVLLFAILIGLIPAGVASSKGHSFFAWWVYGAMIWIVAMPHSLMLKPDGKKLEAKALATGDTRKCPHCAEIIKAEAKVCRFCGRDIHLIASVAPPPPPADAATETDKALMAQFGIYLVDGRYHYRNTKYDGLADAVRYARSQNQIPRPPGI